MSNTESKKDEQPHVKRPLTAHELIQRHIEHPEEPITDEDIENIRVGIKTDSANETSFAEALFTADQQPKAHDRANKINKDRTGSSNDTGL